MEIELKLNDSVLIINLIRNTFKLSNDNEEIINRVSLISLSKILSNNDISVLSKKVNFISIVNKELEVQKSYNVFEHIIEFEDMVNSNNTKKIEKLFIEIFG